MPDTELIEREAKLFEAGNYPDKGVEITEADLDAIVAGTSEPPVRVEHTDTPFDGALGVLKSVYRKGTELFGKLAFPQAAWALIEASGAKRLSVGIKKDKSAISEVSLVRNPRIADAAVFASDCIGFDAGEIDVEVSGDQLAFASQVLAMVGSNIGRQPEGGNAMPDEVTTFTKEEAAEMVKTAVAEATKSLQANFASEIESRDKKIATLQADAKAREVDGLIDTLKRAGKLAPAAEEFARAILAADDGSVVKFKKEDSSITALFSKMMEAQPKIIDFGEGAPGSGTDDKAHTFSEGEVDMYLRTHPGVTRDQAIEKMTKFGKEAA